MLDMGFEPQVRARAAPSRVRARSPLPSVAAPAPAPMPAPHPRRARAEPAPRPHRVHTASAPRPRHARAALQSCPPRRSRHCSGAASRAPLCSCSSAGTRRGCVRHCHTHARSLCTLARVRVRAREHALARMFACMACVRSLLVPAFVRACGAADPGGKGARGGALLRASRSPFSASMRTSAPGRSSAQPSQPSAPHACARRALATRSFPAARARARPGPWSAGALYCARSLRPPRRVFARRRHGAALSRPQCPLAFAQEGGRADGA